MTLRPWSLSRRLILWLGAITLLSWCASSVWLYVNATRESGRLFDDALEHTAHAVLAVVRNEASELTETPEGVGFELAVIDQSDHNPMIFQVRGPNGVMVYRSHGAPVEPLATRHARGFSDVSIRGIDYRVYSLATELDAATIHVAQSLAYRAALDRANAGTLLAPLAALMFVVVTAVLFTVRRTTRPLVTYADALDGLNVEESHGIDGSRLPTELQPVSRAIDRLLARVQDSLVRERTLTADAAHELRNPLGALRLQAQIAHRSATREEAGAALEELMLVTDRATRIVETILTLARYDACRGSSIPHLTLNLGRLVRLVAVEFETLAETRDIRLTVRAQDLEITGDADALAIALRNLIGNALRFAHKKIAIEVLRQGKQALLTVRDDGPGFTEVTAQRAFHRFYRGPETDRAASGAGLGLALVLRIVQLHSGTVQLAPGISGGAGVEICLG